MRKVVAVLAALLLSLAACSSGGAPASPTDIMSALGCEGVLNTVATPEPGLIGIYACQGGTDSKLDNVRFFETNGDLQAELEDWRKSVPYVFTDHTMIIGDTWLVVSDVSDRIAAAVNYGGEIVHS